MGLGSTGRVAGLDERASVARALRWTLPLAVVAIGFLVAVTFRARPAPGLHGQGLAVSVTLVVFALALVGFERAPSDPLLVRMVVVAVMVACAATLFGIQPAGPGWLMMFPPVSAASFRLSRRDALVVLACALVALAVGAAVGRGRPVDSVILDELAVAAYFGVAVFAGRFIVADQQSQQLIAQLEQTQAALAQAAALAERQRLAREMHDVLAHSLSGLVLNLEATSIKAEQGASGADLHASLTRSHSLAKIGLEEARGAINMLRDDALPSRQRLAALASEFQADTSVPCLLMVVGDERDLASECRLTLQRVTQEALTNIRKHARPDRVDVRLSYETTGVRLTIEDHGSGDRPPPGGGTGYGLSGMRERASLLGGTLSAEATSDGFRIHLWLPV